MARKSPNIPYIHYVGHGDFRLRSKLQLTFEPVDLRKDVGLFEDLKGKLLIFSCCTVGVDRVAMNQLLKVSKAKAIVSYDQDIDDAYAFVAEGLFYSRLFDTRWRPEKIVKRVKSALKGLQMARDAESRNTRSPLICYSNV